MAAPAPDGAITTAGDFQHLAGLYRGIAASLTESARTYCVVAQQVHCPGPAAMEVHTPGAAVQQVKT